MQPTYQEIFAQNQILIKRLDEALEKIQQLESKIKDLKDKLNTNSSNSSKSPSQDPFRKGKKGKPSGLKQGAQKGHQGHSRYLIPLEEVKLIHDLKPDICPECQFNLFDPEIISRGCGKHVKADIPNEAKYGFGPRLMGFITSLSGEFRMSKRQVVALVRKIGIRICSGSVCKIHARASQILKDPYDEIKRHALKQNHLNTDETSWKTLATKRWIWVGCCKDSVFFEIKNSRSTKAFQEVFGAYKGGITTDPYNVYNAHEGCYNKTKATCKDFYKHFEMLWVFIYKKNIEPTNNAAEQALRHGVIWRKLSYGTQSEVGERFVERVMSVAETLKRQVKNSLAYFTKCFIEFIRGGHSPPIYEG